MKARLNFQMMEPPTFKRVPGIACHLVSRTDPRSASLLWTLAGYSTAVPNFSVEFIGTLQNGGTVSTTFSGSGIDFSTFHFGPEWTGLTSVEIPNDAWSMDNLAVTVPEPGFAAFFVAGAFSFSFWQRTRRNQL